MPLGERNSCNKAGWGTALWRMCWEGWGAASWAQTSSEPWHHEGKQCPGLYVSRTTAKQIKESDCSLYSATVRPHLEHCDQFGTLQYGKSTDKLEWAQGRATRMVRDVPCEDRLRDWGLFSWRGNIFGGTTQKPPALWGAYQRDGSTLFPVVLVWRLRGNGHKVKPWRFRLDTRNVFPTKQWSQFAQRGSAVSDPGGFEAHTLGTAQSNLVWPCSWPCSEHGVELEASWGPFQPELAHNPICVREELIYAIA